MRFNGTRVFIYRPAEELCTFGHFNPEVRDVAIDDLELRSASDRTGGCISRPVRSRWDVRRTERTIRSQGYAYCPVIWSCPHKRKWGIKAHTSYQHET